MTRRHTFQLHLVDGVNVWSERNWLQCARLNCVWASEHDRGCALLRSGTGRVLQRLQLRWQQLLGSAERLQQRYPEGKDFMAI